LVSFGCSQEGGGGVAESLRRNDHRGEKEREKRIRKEEEETTVSFAVMGEGQSYMTTAALKHGEGDCASLRSL
jgi:hypothetical protein